MKMTTWQYAQITEVELDERSFNVGNIDVHELVKALRKQPIEALDLHAGAADPLAELRARALRAFDAAVQRGPINTLYASGADEESEQNGEDILAVLQASGAKIDVERDPKSGELLSIHASVTLAVYDDEEISEVLESLQANGPTPAKLLGDLAQTSVGLTGAETQVIGLAEWTIDWKRKTADATTTDDDTYESSLGSTASWSVKAKYMFIDGDTSQSTYILATITSPQSPQPWNFFPTVAQGRSGFTGNAYVDGITIASGMGKVVGLDVSLKGTGPLKVIAQIAPVANPNTGTGETAES